MYSKNHFNFIWLLFDMFNKRILLQRHDGEGKTKTICLFLAFYDILPLAPQLSGPYTLSDNCSSWLS